KLYRAVRIVSWACKFADSQQLFGRFVHEILIADKNQSLPKMIYIVQDIRIVRNVVIAVLLYVYKLSLRADYLILSVSLSHFHHGSNHITWIPYDDNEFEIPELMRQLMKIIGKFRMLQDQDFRIVIFQR